MLCIIERVIQKIGLFCYFVETKRRNKSSFSSFCSVTAYVRVFHVRVFDLRGLCALDVGPAPCRKTGNRRGGDGEKNWRVNMKIS